MNAGKLAKRIFFGFGVVIGLFLVAAILVPVLFKGKILEFAKKQMNEQLNATANFTDIDLSLFRSFPHLSVSILDLSIVGKDNFAGDTLVSAKSIDVAVDLMKAISGNYEILNIGLNTPRIHAIVRTDGKPNWDITKPTPATPTAAPAQSAPFALKLRKYGIENGYIEYNDQQGKTHIIIENLNHKGAGDFTSDNFTLTTTTNIDAVTFISGNVPYLKSVKTGIDLDLAIDNKAHKYSFSTDKIQLNGLRMSFKGFVQMPDTNNMNMDITFATPSNDFKDILSLVPGVYQQSFKDIKTAGKLTLSGFVKGNYNKTHMPAFGCNLGIQDGMVQYPALPQKVSNIQIKLAVNNPDGVPDHTVIDLEKCHISFAEDFLDLKLLLKTPISNQVIDATANASIDLTKIPQFVKMEGDTKMSGKITAAVSVKGSVAAAQKQQFDQIDASGKMRIENLVYSSKDYPSGVYINSLELGFTPKNVSVTNFKGKYMETTFGIDGTVDNMLGYYLHNEALKGVFHLTADKVDCNKLMGTSTATPAATTNPASTQPFLVPSNLDIEAHASVAYLKYDNIEITNLQGGLVVKDETVNLKELGGNAMEGSIKINGSYSTRINKKQPDISFDYTLTTVDIQKTFNSFATAQKIMPIAKYANGKVSSQFGMTGKLNGDMSPVMNSLSGKGSFMLLNCTMSNFPVSDQIVSKLQLNDFKTMSMKDTKVFFSFENGRVTIQPFKLKIGGIDAEIAGSNGFDQTINYGANFTVPKSLLGGQASSMVSGLASKAAASGIPVKIGDKIDLALKITGTITQPKVETDLKNAASNALESVKDEIKKEVAKKVDSVKTVVKDTVKAVAKQAVNAAADEAKKQLMGQSNKKPEDAVKDAANKAGDNLKGLFNKKK